MCEKREIDGSAPEGWGATEPCPPPLPTRSPFSSALCPPPFPLPSSPLRHQEQEQAALHLPHTVLPLFPPPPSGIRSRSRPPPPPPHCAPPLPSLPSAGIRSRSKPPSTAPSCEDWPSCPQPGRSSTPRLHPPTRWGEAEAAEAVGGIQGAAPTHPPSSSSSSSSSSSKGAPTQGGPSSRGGAAQPGSGPPSISLVTWMPSGWITARCRGG